MRTRRELGANQIDGERALASLAGYRPFCEFLLSPPPSSSHHLPSIGTSIHLQLISTPVVTTISMVAIARSFGAARVAARGFSNAGTLCACRIGIH